MFNLFYVECGTCKHIVKRSVAQVIPVKEWVFAEGPKDKEWFFCPEHTKPWTRVSLDNCGNYVYHCELTVSKDGTPIGYVKEGKADDTTPFFPDRITKLDIDTMLCGSEKTLDPVVGGTKPKRKYTKTAKWKKARGKK